MAIGASALHELIERFLEAGASKFVVIPIAEDVPAWLEEIRSRSSRRSSEIA